MPVPGSQTLQLLENDCSQGARKEERCIKFPGVGHSEKENLFPYSEVFLLYVSDKGRKTLNKRLAEKKN